MLVFALSSSDVAVAAEASAALSALVESVPASAELCFRLGALECLVALVNARGPARAVACRTLVSSCNVSRVRWKQVADAITAADAMASLIALILEGAKSEACVQAIMLLQGLAQLDSEQCDHICEADGLAPLVTLVCSSNRCQDTAGATLTALLESSKSANDKARRTKQFCDCVRTLRHQGTEPPRRCERLMTLLQNVASQGVMAAAHGDEEQRLEDASTHAEPRSRDLLFATPLASHYNPGFELSCGSHVWPLVRSGCGRVWKGKSAISRNSEGGRAEMSFA